MIWFVNLILTLGIKSLFYKSVGNNLINKNKEEFYARNSL